MKISFFPKIKNNNLFKRLLSFLLIIIFVAGIFLSPQSVKAMTVSDVLGAPIAIGNWVWEKMQVVYEAVKEKLEAKAFSSAVNSALKKIAFDTATWLGSGGKGQKPMFITEGWDTYLGNIADEAVGEYIENLGKEGVFGRQFNLCEPDLSVKVSIGLGLVEYQRPSKPACTFSQMRKNWSQALEDPHFLNNIQDMFNPTSNDLGIALSLNQKMIETKKEETEFNKLKRLETKGWLNVENLISGDQTSPPGMIEETFTAAYRLPYEYLGYDYGEAFVNASNVFLNQYFLTLVKTKLSEIGKKRYTSPYSGSYGALTNPDASPSAGGISATKDSIKKIIQPDFTVNSDYDILHKLTSCPDPTKAGPTDCVINDKFSQAIQNKLTVAQAMEQGYLNPNGLIGFNKDGLEPSYNQDYPYRSLIILRKYRILPVGWELAAQYIKDYEVSPATLKDLINCYSPTDAYLDSRGDCHYLAGLVDPNWLLKAPLNYCRKQGPGPKINSSVAMQNGTSTILTIYRDDQYCADEQTCIQENRDGSCNYYGYCTEERRKWKFDSDSCDPVYNTCETYKTANGQSVSYLSNTLDYGTCTADNAGCTAYCSDFNPSSVDMEISVSQNSGSFSLPVTTTFSGSVTTFYNYNGSSFGNTNFSPFLQADASNIILYYNNTTDRFYLAFVHGAPSAGSAGTANFRFASVNSNSGNIRLVLQDDADDPANIADNPNLANADEWHWQWAPGTTDGGVIDLPNGNWSITIEPSSWTGINSWRLLYEQGGTVMSRALARDEALTITRTMGSGSWMCTASAGSKKYLNQNASECSADQDGCYELIRAKEGLGTNLIVNSSFEDNYSSVFIDLTAGGSGNIDDWAFTANSNLHANIANVNEPNAQVHTGSQSLRISSAGSLSGLAPAFTSGVMPGNFQFVDGETYSISAWVYVVSGQARLAVGSTGNWLTATSSVVGGWERLKIVFTKDSSLAVSQFLIYDNNTPAEFYVDDIKLERGKTTAYSNYRSKGLIYEKLIPDYYMEACYEMDSEGYYNRINGAPSACDNYARLCSERENGCEMYTSQTTKLSIPGKVNTSNYCSAGCVGYDKYLQTESAFESVKVARLIPKSTKKCNASVVGCDEFTNLDKLEQGGEAKEYYSYQRQCHQPDDSNCGATNSCSCGSFYTWEGSDDSGYQLRLFTLQKVDTATNEPFSYNDVYNGLMCAEDSYDLINNPDCRQFYNQSGQIFYKFYHYTVTCSDNCHAYRRTEKNVVKNLITEANLTAAECQQLSQYPNPGPDQYKDVNHNGVECVFCKNNGEWSNEHQACIYSAIPNEGQKCSAAAAGCREYTGNRGANSRIVLKSTFESGTVEGWEGDNQIDNPSNTSLMIGGHSLYVASVVTGATAHQISKTIGNLVHRDKSYTLSFLTNSAVSLSARIANSASSSVFSNLTITPEESAVGWNRFTLNLAQLDHDIQSDEALVIRGDMPFFIDDITLTEITDRYYLVKPTLSDIPEACLFNSLGEYVGYDVNLGCDQYRDRDNNIYYLNGFNELCPESAVGCELMIDTHNSADYNINYWHDAANDGCANDGPDCATVPADNFIYAVYDKNKKCNAADKGCIRLGAESLYQNAASYQTVYLKNNPDQYSKILCGADEVGCRAWTTKNSTAYFKDPGNQTCEWRERRQRANTTQSAWGWFKTAIKRCDNNADGRVGAGDRICSSNSECLRTETACTSNTQCSSNMACLDGFCHSLCIADANDYECDTDRGTGGSPKTLGVNQDKEPTSQPTLDYDNLNWVGLCPSSQSSCTEYIEPKSSFSPNLVKNSQINMGISPSHWNVSGTTYSQLVPLSEPNSLYRVTVINSANGTGNPALTYSLANCTGGSIYPLETNSNRIGNGANAVNGGASLSVGTSREFYVRGPVSCTIRVNGAVSGGQDVIVNKLVIDYQLKDGLEEKCNGIVNYDSGCVLFNERSVTGATFGQTAYKSLSHDVDQTGIDLAPVSVAVGSAEADSNAIVKVSPDRDCAKWLSCTSYSQDAGGNINCHGMGVCDALGKEGNCSHFVVGRADYNPTLPRNSRYGDYGVDSNLFEPDIKNLAGYVKVGYAPSSNNLPINYSLPNDLYPLSAMETVGSAVQADFNGNFESAGASGLNSNNQIVFQPNYWTDRNNLWNPANFYLIYDPKLAQDENGSYSKDLYAPEGRGFLRADSTNINYSPQSTIIRVRSNTEYTISAYINTSQFGSNNSGVNVYYEVDIQPFGNNLSTPLSWNSISFVDNVGAQINSGQGVISVQSGQSWRRYVSKFTTGAGVQNVRIQLTPRYQTTSTGKQSCVSGTGNSCNQGPVFIDDIQLFPVLNIENKFPGNTPTAYWYAPRSCRLYPAEDALSCDYLERDTGIRKIGWWGYCLEYDRYPGNQDSCLLWWPVNKIAGDEIAEEQSAIRSSLYYCTAGSNCATSTIYMGLDDSGRTYFNGELIMTNLGNFHPTTVVVDLNLGENVLAVEHRDGGGGQWGMCGAILPGSGCTPPPGVNLTTNSAEGWKCQFADAVTGTSWRSPGFDDSDWVDATLENINHADSTDGTPDRNLYDCLSIPETPHVAGPYIYCRKSFNLNWCRNLVQVVNDAGQNRAWALRTSQNSSYISGCQNPLTGLYDGCSNGYDYYPFGSMVTPSNIPSTWSSPVYLLPQLDNNLTQSRYTTVYRYRAGSSPNYYYPFLQRIFAESQYAYTWSGSAYALDNTVRWTVPTTAYTCPAVNNVNGTLRPWRPIFNSFSGQTLWCRNYSGDLGACTSTFVNSAANFSDWCGVPPIISNMRFNHSASNVTLDSGTLYNFTVTVTVDPEQMPLRSVVIRWDDGTADTELFVSDMTRNGNEYTAVVNKAYDWNNFGAGGAQQVVLNNVGVRAVDNWGWCQTTGGCTGWQPFPGTVTVRLAQ